MIKLDPALEPYRSHVERIAGILKLRSVEIKIFHGPGLFGGSGFNVDKLFIQIDPTEAIEFDLHLVRIMAHEMRHQYQHENSWLHWPDHSDHITWRGASYSIFGEYFKLPWERDANEFEAWYMETYARDLETDVQRLNVRKLVLPDTVANAA